MSGYECFFSDDMQWGGYHVPAVGLHEPCELAGCAGMQNDMSATPERVQQHVL